MKHVDVVCACIFNDNNEVLITKRGPGRVFFNRWEFPGGKIEANETHEESLIREIKEELNSLIKVESFITESYYEYYKTEPFPNFSINLYAYKCRLIEGNLDLLEHLDKKFVNLDEILNYDFCEADVKIVKELLKN